VLGTPGAEPAPVIEQAPLVRQIPLLAERSILQTPSAAGDPASADRPGIVDGNQTAADQQQPAAKLARKRYRPPVAVDAPGLAIERSVASAPPVATSPIIDTTGRTPLHVPGKGGPSTKLHMTRAQVRSLTLGGEVRRVSVADRNVCQAVAAGPNQLKLIGVSHGVTRLVVWADTAEETPTRVRTFEIHVQEAVEATGSTPGDKVRLLNRLIADTFPNVRVSVFQQGHQLIVGGECESEETATKIIRMVRKTCLIPVEDEIRVR
jgi:Flp pilus assembly secretin CpaC